MNNGHTPSIVTARRACLRMAVGKPVSVILAELGFESRDVASMTYALCYLCPQGITLSHLTVFEQLMFLSLHISAPSKNV